MSKPKKRSELFLSCDLVDSTNYKQVRQQRATSDGPPWQQTFLEFYRTFPQLVAQKQAKAVTGVSFDLWKPIGDELIMTVCVTKEAQVFEAVDLWIEALNDYGKTLSPYGMGTKGGAFMATFPGPDSEVAVPRQPISDTSGLGVVLLNDQAFKGNRKHGTYVYDYFGPSIDTGFRILGKATPRYFPLSTEVAWALFAAKMHDHAALEAFVYHGSHEMKGVWSGRDYPLFAIDRMHTDPVNGAVKTLTSSGRPGVLDSIALCASCLEAPGWPSAIYLPDAGDERLKREPVDPLDHLRDDNQMDGAEKATTGSTELGEDQPSKPLPMGDEIEAEDDVQESA